MEHRLDRRQLLKAGGAAAIGAAALSVAPRGAFAAPAKAKVLCYFSIPKIKLKNKVVMSDTKVASLNIGGAGHWAGTALPGANGHSVLFGHRTAHGGPLRNSNKLVNGDPVYLLNKVTAGKKTSYVPFKTYTVRGSTIVAKDAFREVLTYGDSNSPYLSLVSCTKPNGQPTSVKFRLVIRCAA